MEVAYSYRVAGGLRCALCGVELCDGGIGIGVHFLRMGCNEIVHFEHRIPHVILRWARQPVYYSACHTIQATTARGRGSKNLRNIWRVCHQLCLEGAKAIVGRVVSQGLEVGICVMLKVGWMSEVHK